MLNLTLRVTQEVRRPKYPMNPMSRDVETDTETLCNVVEQDFSPRMLAAALRELADEVDPRHLRSDGGVEF